MDFRIGSLFSGIGGLELGLERAGIGRTVWQAEQSPFCLGVLARHWPDARRFTDVHEVTNASAETADLICGGFPCQDLSPAGRRAGIEHGEKSGLWREFLRIVADIKPGWVVAENTGHGWAGWVPTVRRDLWELGFSSVCFKLQASDLGAWHRRSRAFVIADRHGILLREQSKGRIRSHWQKAVLAARDGSPWIAPDVAGEQQRQRQTQAGVAPDADCMRQPQQGDIVTDFGGRIGNDGQADAGRYRAIKPCLARNIHGVPRRVDRERALGNAVVPAVAEAVGRFIKLANGKG